MTIARNQTEDLLLDQIYFALDANGFAAFEAMLDNPPASGDCLRRTLKALAPWDTTAASSGKTRNHW